MGRADTRYVGTQPKQDKDAKAGGQAGRSGRPSSTGTGPAGYVPPLPPQDIPKPETQPQQAERPDDGEELPPQAEPPASRPQRLSGWRAPSEAPDARQTCCGRSGSLLLTQRGEARPPKAVKSAAKQRLSKRGKAGRRRAA